MSRIYVALFAVLMLASTVVSTASAQFGVNPVAGWTTAQKRAYLLSQITASVADPAARADAVAKLHRLSDAEVDALMQARVLAYQQAQLAAAQAQLQREIALRNQLLAQYQAQPFYGGAVGYRPVITTLPSGASLGVGAVVSPDRRYVRINATPFFSNVGPVYTYNLKNGQTNVYSYSAHPTMRLEQPEVWYDGLRTRRRYR